MFPWRMSKEQPESSQHHDFNFHQLEWQTIKKKQFQTMVWIINNLVSFYAWDHNELEMMSAKINLQCSVIKL